MRNKVFKWFDFLKECEPKTIIGVITVLVGILGTLYATQNNITKWILNTENAICESKKNIEEDNKRQLTIDNHNSRIMVLESNYRSIDDKLNILIARTK